MWFNLTPNNKSQKQTVHINIIFCEFRLLHWLFVLHPRNTELFMATSFILFKLAIQNPNVCYSFFIMGSPTCNGITCIMHIIFHIYFSKTKSVLVIAKITVVFQGVNELHVNVQNDINHSWTFLNIVTISLDL